MPFEPCYIKTFNSGDLKRRIKLLYKILEDCTICPRNCHVNRIKGELGICKVGKDPFISSVGPHFGEEKELVGRYGSGTIFLTGCNLKCIFCQNYDISHLGVGEEISIEELAEDMLYLQKIGCHNINFVTPTHQIPQIVASLEIAIERGLKIPLVYNTGGYDSVETLKILDGIFDIYMPDFKYWDEKSSERYSKARDYPSFAKKAIKEMFRQVGNLILDENGIALRGLIIRHLVLPDGREETENILKFIAEEISKDTYVNIMDQYRPCYRANEYPPLNRRITYEEFKHAIETALNLGLHRGFLNE